MLWRNLDVILLALSATCAAFSFAVVTLGDLAFLSGINEIQQAGGAAFLRSRPVMNFSTIAFTAIFLVAYLRIRNRQFELQKALLSEQLVREIDYRDTAMNTHAIVSVTDPDGRICEANENFVKSFGYSHDEIIGKSSSDLYGVAGEENVFEEIRIATTEGRVWSGEQRLCKKDGSILYVNSTVVPQYNSSCEHVRNITIRTDVTQARLADADRFLREMLEELQDEVYIYHVDSLRITYANRSARKRCDWNVEELFEKQISDSAKSFDEPIFRMHVEPLMDGSKDVVSIELVHPKGPVEISTRLQNGADGKQVFVSVLRDVSLRKAIESAKVASVSTVSHELRAPLTSILGSLRLVCGGVAGAIDDQAAKILEISQRNAERLLTVVNDILDVEKIHSNQMDFNFTEVDLVQLIREAIENNTGYAIEHGVSFSSAVGIEPTDIHADAGRLMQVLTNLMSNAVKFSPDAGTVGINVQQKEKGVRVSIRDEGPGIADEDQKKLFQMFSQVDPADGRKRDGTGLGLAIVKSILKKHGFKVGVISNLGKGSEFYFDVPDSKLRRTRDDNLMKVVNG